MLGMMPYLLLVAITELILSYALGTLPKELKPEHGVLDANPAIRGDLLERVRTGTITPHRGSIKRFTKKGIELTSGEMVEPLDAVIAATGYSVCSHSLISLPPPLPVIPCGECSS